MSSPSPGMVTRVRSRTRQISPITIRPSLDRSKTETIASNPTAATDRRGPIARCNESATSSSSSSTVIGIEQGKRERKVPSQKDAHSGVLKRRQISSGSASPGSFASRITSPQTSNGSKKPSISTSTTSPNLSLPDSHLSPISTHDSNIEEKTRGLSPGNGNGTARFGFFSRKSPAQENVAASAVLRKEKKVVRKGPMAGTGHEGYGKYGIGRGRSISTNSLTSSFGRSPSSESITSNNAGRPPANRKDSHDNGHRKDNMSSQKETGMDDFLRERLQPVILRGEGSAGSSIATSSEAAVSTSSLGSAPPPRPATAPRNDSNASLAAATGSQRPSVDRSRPTLLPSSMTDSIRGKSPLRALAGRHKRTVSNDSALSVEPAPQYSNTTYGPSGSKKVIIASPSTDSSPARPQKKEKDGPSKLNRKWNFFQRAHSTPKNPAPPPSMAFKQQMPFTVPSSLSNRPVAHYALDETEEKPINIQELELMMEEVARAHPPPNNILGSPFGDSRKPGTLASEDPPAGPALPPDSIIPRPLFCNGSGIGNYDEPAFQRRTSGQSGYQLSEFLAFPRKYSEISHTSSSNAGYSSYALTPGPHLPPEEDEVWREYDDLIDEVMSSPDNRTPKNREERKRANLTKDSVTGKFMERMSRRFSDQAPTSWLQDPSRPGTVFEEHQDGAESTELPNPFVEKPKVAVVDFEDANVSPKTTRVARNPSTSVHLRRSQMLANFQPLAMLQTAGPVYNAPLEPPKDVSFTDPEGRLSLPSAPKSNEATGESSENSKPANASLFQTQADAKESTTAGLERVEESPKPIASGTRYRDSRLMEASEYQHDGVISMANLRVGALKTSKWLSFGRVLFSPAHSDLEESNDERVLILDDWSYFCALTYPRTHFYYLSPAPSSSSQSSGPINPPPNYTHIHHSHASAPFPFPRGFFAAVVYRFPTAAPESVYRVIVGECKRVLRPGGYLELSAIDLDLVSMGQHARKRVRDLKWEMQNVEADVCLANASDILLRLVGRRGFEAIKRGVVGVPVSGSLRKSGGESGLGSVATGSTTASSTTGPTTSLGNPSSTQLTELSSNTSPTNATSGTPPDFGFAPDLSSTAFSAATQNDDNMIARVGRWWYSRCYETSMLPRSESGSGSDAEKRSMFADQALLRECEERGTNFRLLICYAQKPEQVKRRTVSV
ncbi:hypothetical protein BC567DRAFT_212164 [Phyllosticta citribraziliensis]